MTAPVRALLIDIDGTLVDSNYQHVVAWYDAFHRNGYRDVTGASIHRSLGLAGPDLISHLVGNEDERLADRHDELLREMCDQIEAIPGAPELLQRAGEAGLAVVLVTSAGEQDLEWMLPLLGTGRDAVTTLITSDDIDDSKPDPQPFLVAAEKAGVPVAECVVIGDSVWDMKAAARGGFRAIGLTCGGTSAAELTDAGADEVYDGPADIELSALS